ncbi:hypothetical protein PG5_65990 [Pseudomonas sp. G5(2012)]|nr:hypothetical protein PG5_65990 [Pseudomonas sp. G5(2012)]
MLESRDLRYPKNARQGYWKVCYRELNGIAKPHARLHRIAIP